jgi:hypothetical protein
LTPHATSLHVRGSSLRKARDISYQLIAMSVVRQEHRVHSSAKKGQVRISG